MGFEHVHVHVRVQCVLNIMSAVLHVLYMYMHVTGSSPASGSSFCPCKKNSCLQVVLHCLTESIHMYMYM